MRMVSVKNVDQLKKQIELRDSVLANNVQHLSFFPQMDNAAVQIVNLENIWQRLEFANDALIIKFHHKIKSHVILKFARKDLSFLGMLIVFSVKRAGKLMLINEFASHQ